MRLFGFPKQNEEGHNPHTQWLLGRKPRLGHLHQPHIQAEVGRGPRVTATPSPLLGGEEPGVSGRWIWKPESPLVAFDNAREVPLPKRVSSLRRRSPQLLLSSTETKTRMDISVKRTYKNCLRWTSR